MRLKTLLLYFLLFFSAGQATAVEYCQNVHSVLPFFYPAAVKALSATEDHTIKDMNYYLREKLGEETVEKATLPETKFILVLGSGETFHENLSSLPLPAVPEFTAVDNPFGAFNVSKVKTRDKTEKFILSNINGLSRYTQVLSLLKLAGVKERQIQITGNLTSYEGTYLRTFANLGAPADLVIFGFANTAVEGFFEQGKPGQYKSMEENNRNYSAQKWIKPKLDEHELTHMGVQEVTLATGKKIWFIDNEYGDRAGEMIRALRTYGAKNVVTIGTGGSLSGKHEIGDVVVPTLTVTSNGLKIPVKNNSDLITPDGNHVHVDSPTLETKKWLDRQMREKNSVVDVELQKINEAVTDDMNISPYLIISDILVGEKTSDYTQWNDDHRSAAKIDVQWILRAHLRKAGIEPDSEIVSYKIFYFGTAGVVK